MKGERKGKYDGRTNKWIVETKKTALKKSTIKDWWAKIRGKQRWKEERCENKDKRKVEEKLSNASGWMQSNKGYETTLFTFVASPAHQRHREVSGNAIRTTFNSSSSVHQLNRLPANLHGGNPSCAPVSTAWRSCWWTPWTRTSTWRGWSCSTSRTWWSACTSGPTSRGSMSSSRGSPATTCSSWQVSPGRLDCLLLAVRAHESDVLSTSCADIRYQVVTPRTPQELFWDVIGGTQPPELRCVQWTRPKCHETSRRLFYCVLNSFFPDGRLDVFQHNKLLTSLTVWTTFGELAILYNCTRTASVRGEIYTRLTSELKLWPQSQSAWRRLMSEPHWSHLVADVRHCFETLSLHSQEVWSQFRASCVVSMYAHQSPERKERWKEERTMENKINKLIIIHLKM